MLASKIYHINRLKQYYMNVGEIGKNGQLKIVENVSKMYDIWKDIKEDEVGNESSENDKEMTVDM